MEKVMNADEIKAGDVVQLKSGSLPMTVTETNDQLAWVVWSNPEQDIKSGHFEKVALTKI